MLLQVAAHRVRSLADRHSKEALGVTAAQLGVLFVVADAPGCTQREVARGLKIRESAVTGSVTRMVAEGLIRRDRTDGRSFGLYPTDRGQAVLEAARPLVRDLEDRLASGFTAAEVDVVARYLRAAILHFPEAS